MKVFSITLMQCLFLITFTHAEVMIFEFGFDLGQIIYTKEGNIPLLKYETIVNIPVPENMAVTYVKVTVDSLSPPKVDYEAEFKQVSIKYTWTQITASSYKILVKGVPK